MTHIDLSLPVANGRKHVRFNVKNKPHTDFALFILFVISVIIMIVGYSVGWTVFLVGLVWTISNAYQFFDGSTVHVLELAPTDTCHVYKIGQVYFVGASEDEAILFTYLHKLNAEELELVSSIAYKYSHDKN